MALSLVAQGASNPSAFAAEPAGQNPTATEKILLEDIKAQEDPTILKSRAWAEAEFNDDRDDRNSLELTFGARKGWRISDDHDWGLQIELPYKRLSSDGPAGGSVSQGLADIKVTLGTAFRLSETWRIGGGVELRMPTGEDRLSGNIWRLQEFVAVAWDAAPNLSFSPKARYFHTVAKDRGAASQNYLELFFPATVILPDRWSVTPRYEAKADFKNDTVTHSGKLSVGKQLEHPQLGLGLAVKVPFNRTTNEYQLVFNVTKYF